MKKVDIAGLKIDSTGKAEFLTALEKRLAAGKKTWIITPYSEFLLHALKDPRLMQVLNRADFAVPDGISLFVAKKYLEIPLPTKNYWLKIFRAVWQLARALAAAVFYPSWIKSALPEKIPGSDLVWDLAGMARANNWSVFLLGGFGNTPRLAAEALLAKFPNLKIAGASSLNPHDPELGKLIASARPNLLLVAYGPIKQELWIAANLPKLPSKLFIGLGGTFDYLAKKRVNPPGFLRSMGLEWLFRLLTQPWRIRRIYRATFGLCVALLRYKVFSTYGLRPNAAVVVLNEQNQIMVCRRNPKDFRIDLSGAERSNEHNDYWQFPQGGIDPHEELLEAAKRELWEETGITEVEHLHTSAHTHTYRWNNAGRHFWPNRRFAYSGQKQRIVYLRFTGREDGIKFPNHEELMEHAWIKAASLLGRLTDERQTIGKIVLEDLKEMREKGIITDDKNAINDKNKGSPQQADEVLPQETSVISEQSSEVLNLY